MHCPRCAFEGNFEQDTCPQCGYHLPRPVSSRSQPRAVAIKTSTMKVEQQSSFSSGDTLCKGRYRLTRLAPIPRTQQNQGEAWFAIDTRTPQQRLLIRQLAIAHLSAEEKHEAIETITRRFTSLGQFPGTPAVVDLFEEQGAFYLVMEHPSGETLASLLRHHGGKLPEREMVEYSIQICEVLTVLAMQQPPLVHGSISVDTILIQRREQKAFLMYLPPLPITIDKESRFDYYAPEQSNEHLQPSIDLYATAATLYRSVTGYDPRDKMSFFFPPVRRLQPGLSQGLESILAQELRLSLTQRYKNPAEMQKALTELLSTLPPATAEAVPFQPGITEVETQLLDTKEVRRQSRRTSIRSFTLAAVIGITILILALVAYVVPLGAYNATAQVTPAQVTATSQAQQNALVKEGYRRELQREQQSYQQRGIGLSDGNLIFDAHPDRKDVQLKRQAVDALQKGQLNSAIDLFTKAVNADTLDGEARIYLENAQILQRKSPYITVALGATMGDTNTGDARDQLRAAYLAQHAINTKHILPHGLQLRLIIANAGTDNTDAITVAQFIANRVTASGNPDHLVATSGWPYPAQAEKIHTILAQVHIPYLSLAASSTPINNPSYFFSLVPNDEQQGKQLVNMALNNMNANSILVLQDPDDSASLSLASQFTNHATDLNVITSVENIKTNQTTVAEYQAIIERAISKFTHVIFIAGSDVDAVRLAHAAGNEFRLFPTSYQLNHMTILGGSTLSSNLLLGKGDSTEAEIARNFPNDMKRIYLTAFANAATWAFLGISNTKQPALLQDWISTYQQLDPIPSHQAMLTYDALGLIATASAPLPEKITGEKLSTALATIGHGSTPAYQGFTGRLLFDANGYPVDKTIVEEHIENIGNGNQFVIIALAGTFQVQ